MFNRDTNHDPSLPRCYSCGHPIEGAKVCSCGAGTANMSFAERNALEVERYKAYKARQVASA